MSDTSTSGSRGDLSEKVDGGLDRVIRVLGGDDSGASLTGMQRELFEVLVASDETLETMDLEHLSESVDVESLRDRIDFERLGEAIAKRDPDIALDLSDLDESIDTEELLDSTDLLEFAKAKRRLDEELEDAVGEDGLSGGGGDSKAGRDVSEFLSSLTREAKHTALRQEARQTAATAQEAIVDGHVAMEEVYWENKRRFDGDDQGSDRNPTAVSLVSPGPLPDGASTRRSTVPAGVRHSKTEPLSRVYSRRWMTRGSGKR